MAKRSLFGWLFGRKAYKDDDNTVISEESKMTIAVDRVSCSMRRSLDFEIEWRTVEVGIEATVPPGMTIQDAQNQAYRICAQDLNTRVKLIRGLPSDLTKPETPTKAQERTPLSENHH